MRYRLRTLLILLALAPPLLWALVLFVGWAAWWLSKPFADFGNKDDPVGVTRYSLEVRLESGITSEARLKEEKDDLTLSGYRVQVEDEQIIINGKKYGKLRPEDQVLIERDGQVLINGIVREPE